MRQTLRIVGALVLGGWMTSIVSAAMDFDFKDPKGVNTISFVLDSELEPILGLASGISGNISYDPANAKATKGKITVETESIHFQNKGMTDTLFKDDWIDAKKNPQITFEFKEVKEAKAGKGDEQVLTVVGDFTCHGVTKSITVPVKATYLKGRAGDRMRGAKGDLLKLAAEFSISRKDFGIKPEMAAAVVSDDITLHVLIVGLNKQ